METYKKIIIIFLFLHLVGSVFLIISTGERFTYWDEEEYYTIANNVIEKGHFSRYGVENNACRPPGYPFFLMAIMIFSDSIMVIKLFQLLLYYISAYLIYKITQSISSNQQVSFLSAGLFLIYPSILYTVNTVYPQVLYMCLFLLLIYLLLAQAKSVWIYLIAGIINGFLILVIPLHILFFPFIIFLIWKKAHQAKLGKSIVFVLFTFLVLLPWTWRNYKIFDEFVFISTNGGKNLLFGNCPLTTPNLGTTDISDMVEEDVIANINQAEIDHYYRSKVFGFIKQDPLHYLGLYFRKFINYFNFRNNLSTDNIQERIKYIFIAVTWYPVLLLAIIGLGIKEIRKNYVNFYLLLLFIFSGLFYAVFFTRIRFRLPFVPFLIIIAAQTLFYLYNKLKK
ncbi:MAG: glycosyltransferase family 39 protein [bacterium]